MYVSAAKSGFARARRPDYASESCSVNHLRNRFAAQEVLNWNSLLLLSMPFVLCARSFVSGEVSQTANRLLGFSMSRQEIVTMVPFKFDLKFNISTKTRNISHSVNTDESPFQNFTSTYVSESDNEPQKSVFPQDYVNKPSQQESHWF